MPLFPGQMAVDHLQTMTRASFGIGRAYGMTANFGMTLNSLARLGLYDPDLGYSMGTGETQMVQPTVEPPSRTALPLLVLRGFVPYVV